MTRFTFVALLLLGASPLKSSPLNAQGSAAGKSARTPAPARAPAPTRDATTRDATTRDATTLADIDSLVSRSHFRDADAALDQWERDHAGSITPAQRATALLLRGRMTLSADSARPFYVQLSIGYPSSPEAPVAFMRLAQMAVAANDTARAAEYFRRVVSDYPLAPSHTGAISALAALGSRTTTRVVTIPPRTSGPARTQSTDTPHNDDAKNAAYSLQVGTYRSFSTARDIQKKLDRLGYETRIVSIAGSPLARLRVGRFASSRAADNLMRRLREAGYEAVVVDDARAETLRSR